MIKKFSKSHPWLYKELKKKFWPYLFKHSKRERFQFYISEFDLDINLLTKDDSVSKYIFLDKYEMETLSVIKKLILSGDVIYDVGGNIGYYTLIFSKLVGLKGQVHTFEPSFREFSLMTENIRLNGINNVYVNLLAVSNINGMIELSVFDDSAFGAYNTIGNPTHYRVVRVPYTQELVRSITLDSYYSLSGCQRPTLIKLDIEGSELEAIKGGQKILRDDEGPILIFEICKETLSGNGVVPTQVFELLEEYGYKIFAIQLDGLINPNYGKSSLNFAALKDWAITRSLNAGLNLR